jgi:hypothetical protein
MGKGVKSSGANGNSEGAVRIIYPPKRICMLKMSWSIEDDIGEQLVELRTPKFETEGRWLQVDDVSPLVCCSCFCTLYGLYSGILVRFVINILVFLSSTCHTSCIGISLRCRASQTRRASASSCSYRTGLKR